MSRVPRPAPAQVLGLDVLRLVAALLVTIYHLTYLSWAAPHDAGSAAGAAAAPFRAYADWRPFVDTGWTGVQMFFVISGFVIAYTANGRSPSAFLRSRILRLVPGIWVCATLSLFVLLVVGTPLGEAGRLYLLSLVVFPIGPWVADSYWTLPLEMAFYAFIFLILCRDRFDRLEPFVLALGGVSLLLWMASLLIPAGPVGDIVNYLAHHHVPRLLLLQHGCFFALGAMIWIVRERGVAPARLVALALLLGACLIEIADETRNAAAWAHLPMSAATALATFVAFLIVMTASLRWNAALHARLGRRARAVRAAGLMTYPLYLLHQPICLPLSAWQLRRGGSASVTLIVSMTLVLLLAWFVALRIEPWLRARVAPKLEQIEDARPAHWGWAVRPTRRLAATQRA